MLQDKPSDDRYTLNYRDNRYIVSMVYRKGYGFSFKNIMIMFSGSLLASETNFTCLYRYTGMLSIPGQFFVYAESQQRTVPNRPV